MTLFCEGMYMRKFLCYFCIPQIFLLLLLVIVLIQADECLYEYVDSIFRQRCVSDQLLVFYEIKIHIVKGLVSNYSETINSIMKRSA